MDQEMKCYKCDKELEKSEAVNINFEVYKTYLCHKCKKKYYIGLYIAVGIIVVLSIALFISIK